MMASASLPMLCSSELVAGLISSNPAFSKDPSKLADFMERLTVFVQNGIGNHRHHQGDDAPIAEFAVACVMACATDSNPNCAPSQDSVSCDHAELYHSNEAVQDSVTENNGTHTR